MSTTTIVQITDTHLFADQATELLGFYTHHLLVNIVDHVVCNPSIKPDLLLVTGDISEDESKKSYQLALSQFERLQCPIYWIHGNHDDEATLKAVFDRSPSAKKLTQLTIPGWDFISVNTCRPGFGEGYIEDKEYQDFLLKIKTAKSNNTKIAVVMHHHPAPVNTPSIDEYMLRGGSKFLELIKQHPEIKLVICGHVHGDYKIAYDGFSIETCPATCFQYRKWMGELETENKRGYKIFQFNPDLYTSSTIFV